MLNQMTSHELWAVVLAGGEGKRLQEYTRDRLGVSLPKQFCVLHGTRSLLQRTVSRVNKLVPAARTVITVPQAYLKVAIGQLDGRRIRLAVQPCNRDTTAAVFLSLLYVYKQSPDAMVVVVPSDHYVSPEEAFLTSLLRATRVASAHRNRIVLIGCKPGCRDTDLGFVVPAAEHSGSSAENAILVSCVEEKPNQSLRDKLVDRCAYLNTFIMVGALSAFLKAGYDTVPGILSVLEELHPVIGTPREQETCKKAFARISNSNFTKDVLSAVPDRLLLVPMNEPCHWLDVGRPEKVEQMLQLLSGEARNLPDASRTAIVGPAVNQHQETHGHAYR
ncbi:MAG: sugar phosphate nucleotidyltransferase [bacterium]